MRRALPLCLAVIALAAPAGAIASECPKTTLADVEDEVMCPVCGTPLELATEAPQAQRERELIRRLVDRCKSKDEVKAVLAAEFGDDVLATPGGDGFDLAAYLVPALAILLAGVAVAVAALRWRSGSAAAAGPSLAHDRPAPAEEEGRAPDAAAERLDSDLDRYDL